ncbi:MAG: FAD-dependent oxidoreductase [Candidatus Muiribacteriota bacterium]
MSYEVIVIGGNAAGLSAAMEAKRQNPSFKITVFEKGEFISYGACGLPYYLGGMLENPDDLMAKPPSYFEKKDVKVYKNTPVIDINSRDRKITALFNNKEQEFGWDKLIIATGAYPRKLPFEKENLKNLFHFTKIEHVVNVKKFINENNVKKVMIIGGGYIGIEVADNLVKSGIDVSMVELNRILSVFDKDVLKPVYNKINNNKKFTLYEEIGISSLNEENNKVRSVSLSNGEKLPCDMIIVSAGVIPETELAQKAGIKIGETGAIEVNSKGQTSNHNVFAAGDCAEIYHDLLKKNVYIPLGTNANRAGKTVGRNLEVAKEEVKVLGNSMLEAFDVEIASVGLTESLAIKNNYNYIARMSSFRLKPGYVSNQKILIKYIIDKYSKQLLGVQMAGDAEVHGKINCASIMINNKMTLKDIQKLDFGYHPLLSGLWDPLVLMVRKF